MTLRHEVSVLRKKCASFPAAVNKLTPQQPNTEEVERVERERRDALKQVQGAEKGKQEALLLATDALQQLEGAEKGKQEALFEVVLYFLYFDWIVLVH
jgi:hypothetical protein